MEKLKSDRVKSKFYPISEVTKLTGASEFLLRAWELRYSLVSPHRTSTGRRLYSSQDVLRISKIVSLLQQGHKISKLARLDKARLNQLDAKSTEGVSEFKSPDSYTQEVYASLAKTDWVKVKKIFHRQLKKMNSVEYIKKFILPIAHELSKRSLHQQIDIIQEHMVSALIKESIYSLPFKKSNKKIKILFATTEGDHHDLGLLISKALAEAYGVECIYLGSHVPKKELAEACLRLKPNYLVIGTSVNTRSTAKESLLKYIHFIDQHVPTGIHLCLGGAACQDLVLNLQRDFKVFKSIDEYDQSIKLMINQKDNP